MKPFPNTLASPVSGLEAQGALWSAATCHRRRRTRVGIHRAASVLLISGLLLLASYLVPGQVTTSAPPALTLQSTPLPVPSLPAIDPQTLTWGEPASHLQMAVRADVKDGVMRCWLRNAETQTVTFSAYAVGHHESVHLEIRSGNDWVRLKRAPSVQRAYHGIGPRPDHTRILPGGQIITEAEDIEDRIRIAKRSLNVVGISTGGVTIWSNSYQFQKRGATFMVDLFDFEWPPAMLQYWAVEMRVIQTIAPVMTDYSTRGPWFRVISPVEVINPLALKLANAEWFAVMERATLDLLRTNPPAMKLGNEIPASKR